MLATGTGERTSTGRNEAEPPGVQPSEAELWAKELPVDERMKELIAIGASAAVNCRPCIVHHLAECERIGVARADIEAAIETGMAVNRGAASRTRDHVRSVLGGCESDTGGAGGCGCAA